MYLSLESGSAYIRRQCNFARTSYSFTHTRIFILDSALDSWQTGCIFTSEPVTDPKSTANGNCSAAPGWGKCADNVENCDARHIGAMVQYEHDFVTAVQTTGTFVKNGNGAFIYSCHTHCAAISSDWFTSFIIDGVSMERAVSKWWASDSTTPAADNTHLPCYYNTDRYPRRCNPTCPLQ